MSSATPRPWCHARLRDSTPWKSPTIAVLGVLSFEGRVELRDAIRTTWISILPNDMQAFFVLRGLDLQHPQMLDREVQQNGDVVLVRAASNMTRSVGPMHSLFLWFRCAVHARPDALFIGKLDDDTYIHPFGISSLLRATLPWLGSPFEAYIGRFESYHWDVRHGKPFHYRPHISSVTSPRCKTASPLSPIIGPFSFAKGPAFFLSSKLARIFAALWIPHNSSKELSDPRCLPGSFRFWGAMGASTSSQGCRAHSGEMSRTPTDTLGTLPWEDVWLGFALEQLITGPVALVDMYGPLFVDFSGMRATRAALVWHSRRDDMVSIYFKLIESWSASHHCNSTLALYISCLSEWSVVRGTPHVEWSAAHTHSAGQATFPSCTNQPRLHCRVKLRNNSCVPGKLLDLTTGSRGAPPVLLQTA